MIYYNEFDKKKCAMLKQLMSDGHISKGDIDKTLPEKTLKDTPGATSSQESACGITRSTSQDGQQTDLFGLEAAPASHFLLPVDKKAKQTIATYGQNGSASSASASLQHSLESKLAARLPTGGLTMFIKGWKQKTTPSGRLYCQLAVSVRPTSETDCGLWRTPNATDDRDRGSYNDPSVQRRIQKGKQISLSMIAQGTGRQAYGSTAQTGNKGSLNPAFPCWLMGIPKEWVSSMRQGMQSFLK